MYMSPEVYVDDKEATFSSDIWSLGCVINEIFVQTITWYKEMDKEHLMQILRNRRVPNLSGVPAFLLEMLGKCFSYDPQKRPSAEELTVFIKKSSTHKNNNTG